jgi:hypothetical protein
MTIGLLTPLFTGGIEHTNYFNGRLLTAEALKADQSANRQQHLQLGRALGAGIVHGLLVKQLGIGTQLMVQITPGLAINKLGQALSIQEETVELQLAKAATTTESSAGLFKPCGEDAGDTLLAPEGVSVLVMFPVSGFKGQAPKHEYTDNGTLNGCGDRFAVEGVRFKLVELDTANVPNLSTKTREQLSYLVTTTTGDALERGKRQSRLRNLLAHICLGTEPLTIFAKTPFLQAGDGSAFQSYGGVDALGLDDCEVPLALIYITGSTLHFVDNWAVRRGLTPESPSIKWPYPFGRRQTAEAQAVFFQFQEHLTDLLQKNPAIEAKMKATEYFRFLPPLGLLRKASWDNLATFFSGIPHWSEPRFIDGAMLPGWLNKVTDYWPIDLDLHEGVWLYQVWQNHIVSGPGKEIQPYFVFTTAHMPAWDAGRLDEARWDYFHFTEESDDG